MRASALLLAGRVATAAIPAVGWIGCGADRDVEPGAGGSSGDGGAGSSSVAAAGPMAVSSGSTADSSSSSSASSGSGGDGGGATGTGGQGAGGQGAGGQGAGGEGPVPSGDALWARILDGAMWTTIAAHPDGGVVAMGTFFETLAVGDRAELIDEGEDTFLLRIGDDGSIASLVALGLPKAQGRQIAVAEDGSTYLTVLTDGDYTFGASQVSGHQSVVLKLDAAGIPAWATPISDVLTGTYGLVLASGEVPVVLGAFSGEAVVGGTPLESVADLAGYVLALDPSDGSARWVTELDGTFDDGGVHVTSMAATGDQVAVAGFFAGDLAIEGSTVVSAGENDAFLVRLDAATGTGPILRRFGGAEGDEWIAAIAAGPGGTLAITTSTEFNHALDFGAGPVTHWSNRSLVVAKLDADDGVLWQAAFAEDAAWEEPAAIHVDPVGRVALAGRFDGTIDFGGETFEGSRGAAPAGYFAVLAPDGGHVASWAFEGGSTISRSVVLGTHLFGVGQFDFVPTTLAGVDLVHPGESLTAQVLVGLPVGQPR